MKFELEQYDDNCVMSCPTRESAEIFLRFLHSAGRRWGSGDRYTNTLNWETRGADTCYNFNSGLVGSIGFYSANDYTILNFFDFEWDELRSATEPNELAISFDEIFYGSSQEV